MRCKHEWELKQQVEYRKASNGKVVEVEFLYICTKCGKFKKIKFK